MTALLLFGDQLGPHFRAEHPGEVLLVESAAALRRKPYHRQKLHLVLSGIRHLAAELGDRATLVRAETYADAVREFGRPLVAYQPGSRAAAALLRRLGVEVLPTPAFALPRQEFTDWAGDRTTFLMEDFYREQRRRFGVLLDGGDPAGGRWNHDAANREPPPRTSRLDVPRPWWPQEDAIDAAVRADLDAMDLPTVGVDGPRWFAITREEALAALDVFVRDRLPHFGPHEDAVLTRDPTMAHSLLSVPLNHGLLHPLEVVRAAERAYRAGDAPLASVEGFVRQVLGWREYVWHLYWHLGPEYARHNEFRATAPLPDWWRTLRPGGVRAACVRTALEGVRDHGWVHHIQRLMVLGNHALQRGYDPAALNDWFVTSFVDGFPWVMPVNVVGMSQHADGGVIATKPYLSGGAYLNRMTDHCRDCWFDPRKRTGERACPFTAGYWAWLDRHAARLRGNHRMARPVQGLQRLTDLAEVRAREPHRDVF
ncbi:cryptochrome/photolyase family protein [Umezawaea endophytica]|uniref:Cryptochrome/photolyase family protein n=1 Tax=Umezawaea endophytica TaxID=1654476 RepID=A0A9X3AIS5_9PSEU|nr:cryptochrome/photolyase family protein [Umezawaea endophytica]MCS7483497.1 cryptochrome/photolyase family protein [Umezawaea endophytica]